MKSREIWKDVVGQETRYCVSNLGNIHSLDRVTITLRGSRTLKGRTLKPSLSKRGYYVFNLLYSGKQKITTVHRLVAIAFLPNSKNLLEVNHINGIKTDNRVENLEWCTHQENMEHAFKNNLVNSSFGEKHPKSKLTNIQVIKIRLRLKNGETPAVLSREFGISNSAMSQIKLGRTYKKIN